MAARKPKKPPAAASDTGGSGRLVRRLLVVGLTLGAAGALVWGVSRLGDEARREISSRDRYTVAFADIACESPPGTDPAAFLSEVRYVSRFPATFQSLDPDLNAKLSAAFAAHPWVAEVGGVSVDAGGKVAVKLRFRTPALAVATSDGTARVVDGRGVLLPATAATAGLPELATPIAAPVSDAGQAWANPTVKRALELLDAHHPRKLETTATGWRLTMPDGKVLTLER